MEKGATNIQTHSSLPGILPELLNGFKSAGVTSPPFSSSSSHRQFSGKDGKVALKNPSCDVESAALSPFLQPLGRKIPFRCPPVRRGGISFSSRHIFWHESTLILPFLSSQVRGGFFFQNYVAECYTCFSFLPFLLRSTKYRTLEFLRSRCLPAKTQDAVIVEKETPKELQKRRGLIFELHLVLRITKVFSLY